MDKICCIKECNQVFVLFVTVFMYPGYRIYVNSQPKGLVAGTQSRALLEGLQARVTYRVTLRAVSALGDSLESRAVHVRLDGQGGLDTDARPPRDQPPSPGPGGGRRSSGGKGSPGPGKNKALLTMLCLLVFLIQHF